MRIALWDIDPFTESKRLFSEIGWEVVLASPSRCGDELLKGNVELALVPSVEVLKDTAAFSVFPDVAFASKSGFAGIALRINRPLTEIRTIHCSEDSAPFFGLASIVLREQYEAATSLVRIEPADADLLFGGEAVSIPDEQRLDLDLEWFELTGVPLAWGFFVVRPGTPPSASTEKVQRLLGTVLRTGPNTESPDEEGRNVLHGDLRVSYDPEVSEGIDQLAHYLFYVGVLDEIPALRLMAES